MQHDVLDLGEDANFVNGINRVLPTVPSQIQSPLCSSSSTPLTNPRSSHVLSRHSLCSVQLATMAHCCYASAPVVVCYSGNRLLTTCGTTPYLKVSM